jgi:sugar phosphate isomerase/epimerase
VRIGLLLETFPDWTLGEIMDFVSGRCPEITDLEVGAGGFAPRPHCPVEELLEDASACERWLGSVTGRGFGVSALNVSGNPLDPLEPGPAHDRALRDAVRLSARLGVDRIVAMVGCPAGRPGDATAHFDAGGWLPYLAGVYERQWESELRPYWEELSAFALAESPGLLICIELHPGTGAHNVETFRRFAELGPNIAVNLDPSHLFWQGMDPLAVLAAVPRVGNAHAKDAVLNPGPLAVTGLLDHRWTATDPDAPWTFAVPGRGHGVEWWRTFVAALSARGVETISIEHEDPTIGPEEGVIAAADVLVRAGAGRGP